MHKIKYTNVYYALVFGVLINFFNNRADSFFLKPEIGILKYHMRTISLEDAAGKTDQLIPVSANIAPLGRCMFGYEYDDLKLFNSDKRTAGRIGFSLEYAHRSNRSVRTDYLDSNTTTASLEGSQNIKNVGLLVVGEYDAIKNRWFAGHIDMGLGVRHAPLTELRLYQKSNDAFIGQAIEPRYFNPTGYIGFGFKTEFPQNEGWFFELNYQLSLTYVDYRKKVIQSKPDAAADISAHIAYELFQDFNLTRAPHMFLLGNIFCVGVQFNF